MKSNREIVAHAVLDYAETTDSVVAGLVDVIRLSQESPEGEKFVLNHLNQIGREYYAHCQRATRNSNNE